MQLSFCLNCFWFVCSSGFFYVPEASPGHQQVWGMFVPFDDQESIQFWEDDEKCDAEIRRLSPKDLDGWRAMGDVKRRLRDPSRW